MIQDLKPKEIVQRLDRYIIGQENAKKSVAIALRNRWRRRQVEQCLRDEIAPKNIILIGATGVGKTEIARRLADLTDSPFYKVEASKFTEVGYVGRDVESMIRDLLELTINKLKGRQQEAVQEKAAAIAEERILDILLPPTHASNVPHADSDKESGAGGQHLIDSANAVSAPKPSTREKLRKMLRAGKLDGRLVDLEVDAKTPPMVEIFSNTGMEEMGINFKDMLGNLMPKNTKRRKIKVSEAMKILCQEEAAHLVDMEEVVAEAIEMVEQSVAPMMKDSSVQVVNLMARIKTVEEFEDPNEVKVVTDLQSNAIYFSREPIPSRKKGKKDVPMMKQVCIIPFKREFLLKFNELQPTPLEIIESVDMMRVIEHGYKVRMAFLDIETYSVDTPKDLAKVEKLTKNDLLLRQYAE